MDENTLNLLVQATNAISSLTILVLWLVREIRRADAQSESDMKELEAYRDIARQKLQTNP